MDADTFRANLCAGMIPDICTRLNRYCDLAKEATNYKEWEAIRGKARRDFSHLCKCIKAITTEQTGKLSGIFRVASDRYTAMFGWEY